MSAGSVIWSISTPSPRIKTMTPLQKEIFVGWALAILSGMLAGLICFGITGCAHKPMTVLGQNTRISNAAEISDRIDAKAVIVREWIENN